MLFNTKSPGSFHDYAIDNVHNYYEQLVIDHILRASDKAQQDEEYMADLACIVLNSLPPRYVRHHVDATFYMSTYEQEKISEQIATATAKAIEYLDQQAEDEDDTSGNSHRFNADRGPADVLRMLK